LLLEKPEKVEPMEMVVTVETILVEVEEVLAASRQEAILGLLPVLEDQES
jgi:hypothetical protein